MRVTTSLSFEMVTIRCLPPTACAMHPIQDSVCPKHKHLPLPKPTSEKLPTSVRRRSCGRWTRISRAGGTFAGSRDDGAGRRVGRAGVGAGPRLKGKCCGEGGLESLWRKAVQFILLVAVRPLQYACSGYRDSVNRSVRRTACATA